ncbi:unnamed protein product [Caenorhabditis auriculariae]|uniref:Alpha-1,3-mannosyl-glycoprotein 2-beta-N-acetylglucosaminyltransferase n=1 Tax=Caenorhabditis auriculariae TaxID=2777116 RepID=A0A8S1GPL2_9PELO|nr:unnamed protein product [Caenorhabditis auriculariae]
MDCFFIILFLLKNTSFTPSSSDPVIDVVLNAVKKLESGLENEQEEITRLKLRMDELQRMKEVNPKFDRNKPKPHSRIWTEPIPVLVFACNRAIAVKEHVKKLLRLRHPNDREKFPIIVSQDCDDLSVRDAVQSFGQEVQYLKHLAGEKANITIPNNHRMYTAYYRIARHYKLALNEIFKRYTSVIITEDDLNISEDFFSYFSATRYLLENDPKLWCVSAWNDNGKIGSIDLDAAEKLYRSDFFPGLGWMMTSKLWNELGPIWPTGFWDDWMRDPLRRKGRQCIRPEISRTGMSNYGKEGASKGQFFSKHLAKVHLNEKFVDFKDMNLDFLLEENYNRTFLEEVNSASLVPIDEALRATMLQSNGENKPNKFRVTFSGNRDYILKADAFTYNARLQGRSSAHSLQRHCYVLHKWSYDPEWYVFPEFGE